LYAPNRAPGTIRLWIVEAFARYTDLMNLTLGLPLAG
jgi:hypothetical protein